MAERDQICLLRDYFVQNWQTKEDEEWNSIEPVGMFFASDCDVITSG